MIPVYDFAELERLVQPCTHLLTRLRISGHTLARYRRERWLTWEQADRLAVRAGFSPYEVWGAAFGDETAALFTRIKVEREEMVLCTSVS